MTYLQPQQMGLPRASRPPTARPRKEGTLPNRSPCCRAQAHRRWAPQEAELGLAWESPPPAPRDPPLCCLCSTHKHTYHTCTLMHSHLMHSVHTYACTHRQAHTYMHAHTQAHTCTLPSRCTRMHSHGRACISIQGTLTPTPLMHTCSGTCNSTHTCMDTHTCTYVHTHAHTQCAHTHTHAHTHLHARTHFVHTCTLTHIHSHNMVQRGGAQDQAHRLDWRGEWRSAMPMPR